MNSAANFVFTSQTGHGLPREVLVVRWVLLVPDIFVFPLSEFEQHMYSSDPRPDTGSLSQLESSHNPKPQPGHFDNSTTRRPRSLSFLLFFDSKPGNCQPIYGIIFANKSFSSAKAVLVCYFCASGKNRSHLGCRNVLRSRGYAVQDKGITLEEDRNS